MQIELQRSEIMAGRGPQGGVKYEMGNGRNGTKNITFPGFMITKREEIEG